MTARTGINISHSALVTEEGCPLRGYLTVRRGIGETEEDTVSRRGTLGHAFLADRLCGFIGDEDLEETGRGVFHRLGPIIDKEHERRGWPDIVATYEDARHAAHGALALFRWSQAERMTPFADGHGRMIECSVVATIGNAIKVLGDAGFTFDDGDLAALFTHCATVKAKIDMVTVDGEVVDWKFAKDKPSGDDYDAESVPDPQHSWYAFVLACAGVQVTRGHRVTVHAEAPAVLATAAELPRRGDGLPSLRHPPTTAGAFLEALASSTFAVGSGRNLRTVALLPPWPMPSASVLDFALASLRRCGEKGIAAAEEMAAHFAALQESDALRGAGPSIAVRSHDLWPHHYLRLAHERLTMFASRLRTGLASRHLRVYPSSPCVRSGRGGIACPVQRICRATLDGQDIDEAIEDAVREESHRRIYEGGTT